MFLKHFNNFVGKKKKHICQLFIIIILDESLSVIDVIFSCTGNRANELVTDWRFVHQKKESYYKIKSNWVLERRFNCRLVFWDRLG